MSVPIAVGGQGSSLEVGRKLWLGVVCTSLVARPEHQSDRAGALGDQRGLDSLCAGRIGEGTESALDGILGRAFVCVCSLYGSLNRTTTTGAS